MYCIHYHTQNGHFGSDSFDTEQEFDDEIRRKIKLGWTYCARITMPESMVCIMFRIVVEPVTTVQEQVAIGGTVISGRLEWGT